MALPINIEELLTGDTVEWDRIEFKKGWNPESIMHTICAFANDINNWGGGYIFIGVDEADGLPVLPPAGVKKNQLDAIQKRLVEISHKITPNYFPVVQPYIKDGKHILVVWVPGGDNRPYQAPKSLTKGSEKAFYIRRNSTTKLARQADMGILKEIAQKIPFDDRMNHHSKIEDLDFGLIRAYLESVKSDLRNELSTISLKDLATQMQIISGSPEDLHPKNIGLLMFNEKPSLFFRGAYSEIVLYKDESGKDFTEKRFEGPIHHQLTSILDYFKNNIIEERVVKKAGVAEASRFFNYPFEAVEEVISNAFYHRSYERDNPVEINIFPNRIEVLSFPGPLPPITQETLKQKRIIARNYRNRRIGDFFKELKLTEGRASGFPIIYNRMETNNSPAPSFETDDDFNYFLCTLPVHQHFTSYQVDDQERKILRFCKVPQKRKDILEKIGYKNHASYFTRHIEPLIKYGFLDYTLPNKLSSPKQRYLTTDKGKEVVQG